MSNVLSIKVKIIHAVYVPKNAYWPYKYQEKSSLRSRDSKEQVPTAKTGNYYVLYLFILSNSDIPSDGLSGPLPLSIKKPKNNMHLRF